MTVNNYNWKCSTFDVLEKLLNKYSSKWCTNYLTRVVWCNIKCLICNPFVSKEKGMLIGVELTLNDCWWDVHMAKWIFFMSIKDRNNILIHRNTFSITAIQKPFKRPWNQFWHFLILSYQIYHIIGTFEVNLALINPFLNFLNIFTHKIILWL